MKPHCPSSRQPVSVARINELLTCDFTTGQLTWKVTRGGFAKAGSPAGKPRKDGYVGIKIEGRQYLAHRVIWAMYHGEWPIGQIDHRNLRRSNNWIKNLREATNALNQVNRNYRRASGLPRGVGRQRNGRFQAQIQIAGKKTSLGTFDTPDQAGAAYRAAALEAFGDFAFDGGTCDR